MVKTEDELDLVVDLFEKVTDKKTAYRHVERCDGCDAQCPDPSVLQGLESGTHFLPFPDYRDALASPLSPDTFAAFVVPLQIPPPPQCSVMPSLSPRTGKSGGHRVIPAPRVRIS